MAARRCFCWRIILVFSLQSTRTCLSLSKREKAISDTAILLFVQQFVFAPARKFTVNARVPGEEELGQDLTVSRPILLLNRSFLGPFQCWVVRSRVSAIKPLFYFVIFQWEIRVGRRMRSRLINQPLFCASPNHGWSKRNDLYAPS